MPKLLQLQDVLLLGNRSCGHVHFWLEQGLDRKPPHYVTYHSDTFNLPNINGTTMTAFCLNQERYRPVPGRGIQAWNTPLMKRSINIAETKVCSSPTYHTCIFPLIGSGTAFPFKNLPRQNTAPCATARFNRASSTTPYYSFQCFACNF